MTTIALPPEYAACRLRGNTLHLIKKNIHTNKAPKRGFFISKITPRRALKTKRN